MGHFHLENLKTPHLLLQLLDLLFQPARLGFERLRRLLPDKNRLVVEAQESLGTIADMQSEDVNP